MSVEHNPPANHPSDFTVPQSGGGKWGCLVVLLILAVGGVGGLVYTHIKRSEKEKAGESKGPKAVPVLEAKVARKDVPIEIHVVGDVQPYSTVPVTALIGGQLTHVYFKQGDYVREGQALFRIDPRPLQAASDQANAVTLKDNALVQQAAATMMKDQAVVRQAQAMLLRDAALVNQARSNERKDVTSQVYATNEDQRYRKLLGQGYATVEQAEGQRSTAEQAANTVMADVAAIQSAQATVDSDKATIQSDQATVAADLASLKSAQATLKADTASAANATVQLSYTDIRSPINGRTGTLNIFQGTIVKANDTTPLITIDQIQPIYVAFSIPERYLPQVREYQKKKALRVSTEPTDVGEAAENGFVSFIENTVDNTTGTILLRGTFPNKSRTLWPGHFVNVNLLVSIEKNALMVPTPAVQPSQQGDAVFVVKSDNTVELRPVKVKFTHGDMSVIASGLKEGETVVTDGQLQLTPGASVRVAAKGERGTTASPLGAVGPGASEAGGDSDTQTPSPDGSSTPGRHRHHRHHGGADASPSPEATPAATGTP